MKEFEVGDKVQVWRFSKAGTVDGFIYEVHSMQYFIIENGDPAGFMIFKNDPTLKGLEDE
jgi:hypothetical protein